MGKKNKRGKKNVIKCETCNGIQDEPVVACDKCSKWHHFRCVGITSIGKKDEWLCAKCTIPSSSSSSTSIQSLREVATPRYSNLTLPSNNPEDYDLRYDPSHPYYRANPRTVPSASNISKNRSVEDPQNRQIEAVSISSRFSNISQRSQRIELELIEEERILQEKRDRQYLEHKYRILI